jgi:hypothetical protein
VVLTRVGWKERVEPGPPPQTTFMCPEGNVYFTTHEVFSYQSGRISFTVQVGQCGVCSEHFVEENILGLPWLFQG